MVELEDWYCVANVSAGDYSVQMTATLDPTNLAQSDLNIEAYRISGSQPLEIRQTYATDESIRSVSTLNFTTITGAFCFRVYGQTETSTNSYRLSIARGFVEEDNAIPTVLAADSEQRFSTLLTAVEAAGLTETLSGDGPFTVFAPTNDAFDALPEGALDDLLSDAGGALRNTLLYHVLNAEVLAADLTDGQVVETALGEDITVTITAQGEVFINDTVEIIETDIMADNGVIHVLDAVLAPQLGTIPEVLAARGDFETLLAAVGAQKVVVEKKSNK